jgi:hypothetical protein
LTAASLGLSESGAAARALEASSRARMALSNLARCSLRAAQRVKGRRVQGVKSLYCTGPLCGRWEQEGLVAWRGAGCPP